MKLLSLAALAALASASRLAKPTPQPARTSGPGSRPARVGAAGAVDASAAAAAGRAELIDYKPVADPAAVVVDSAGKARFTVLTVRRLERARAQPPPSIAPASRPAPSRRPARLPRTASSAWSPSPAAPSPPLRTAPRWP